MAHPRVGIRDALASALDSLMDSQGNAVSVFTNRSYALEPRECPAALVYTENDTAEVLDQPRRYERQLEVLVDLVVIDDDLDDAVDPADSLDHIAEQVEKAIEADPVLGGAARETTLTNTGGVGLVETGDGGVAARTLTFVVDYITQYLPDPADLPDWQVAYGEWHLEEPASPDDEPDLESRTDIPQ